MYKQFSKTLKTAALLTTLFTSMTSATSFQVFLGLRATLLGGFKTKNDLQSLINTVTKIKALDQAKVKTSLGVVGQQMSAIFTGAARAPITLALVQANQPANTFVDFDGKQIQQASILDQMNLIANTLVIAQNQFGSDTDLSGLNYNLANSLSITLGARFLFSLSGDDFWKAGLQAQGGWAPSGTQTLGKNDKDNASISFTNSLRFSIDAIASFGYGYAGIGFAGQNATIKANDTFNKVINDKKGREELYSALNNTPAAQPHGLLLKDTTPAGNNGLLNDTTWTTPANSIKNFFEGDLAKTENFDGTIADGMMFGVNLRLGAMFPVWNALNLYVEGGNFFSMSKLDSKNASIAASEFYGSLWNPFLELGVALSF